MGLSALRVILAVSVAHPDLGPGNPWGIRGVGFCSAICPLRLTHPTVFCCLVQNALIAPSLVCQALDTEADVAPELCRHTPLSPKSIKQPGHCLHS